MATAVEVAGLEKHYGNVPAVDGISFSVGEGEVFGLLGHNGAGKTTTIRVLTGRARPTKGTATVAGYDVVSERAGIKPLINAVFEDQNLYVIALALTWIIASSSESLLDASGWLLLALLVALLLVNLVLTARRAKRRSA